MGGMGGLLPLLGEQIVASQEAIGHIVVDVILVGTHEVGAVQQDDGLLQVALCLVEDILHGVHALLGGQLVGGEAVGLGQIEGQTLAFVVNRAIGLDVRTEQLDQVVVGHATVSQGLAEQGLTLFVFGSEAGIESDDLVGLGNGGVEGGPVGVDAAVVVHAVVQLVVVDEPRAAVHVGDVLAHEVGAVEHGHEVERVVAVAVHIHEVGPHAVKERVGIVAGSIAGGFGIQRLAVFNLKVVTAAGTHSEHQQAGGHIFQNFHRFGIFKLKLL